MCDRSDGTLSHYYIIFTNSSLPSNELVIGITILASSGIRSTCKHTFRHAETQIYVGHPSQHTVFLYCRFILIASSHHFFIVCQPWITEKDITPIVPESPITASSTFQREVCLLLLLLSSNAHPGIGAAIPTSSFN